jgi:uncharacterized coiled-coil protein SlyX
MKIISSSVHESIFQEKEGIDFLVLNNIYEKHTETILDNKAIPYFYIAESATELLETFRKDIAALKSILANEKNGKDHIDLKNELKQKETEIKNMKIFIETNITEPLKQKESYIKMIEEKVSHSTKIINKLNATVAENEEIIKQTKSQLGINKRKIIELQNADEEKEMKIKDLIKNNDEIKNELKLSYEENYKIKYYLETSILKLKQASERERQLEIRNRDAENRNLYLGVRAAEGFENLTPRPSFIGIEELLPEIPKSTKEKARKVLSLCLIKNKVEIELNKKRPGFAVSSKRSETKASSKPSGMPNSPVLSTINLFENTES